MTSCWKHYYDLFWLGIMLKFVINYASLFHGRDRSSSWFWEFSNGTAIVGNFMSLSRLPFNTCASATARQNTKQTDKFLAEKNPKYFKIRCQTCTREIVEKCLSCPTGHRGGLYSRNVLQSNPNVMADGSEEGGCLAPLPSATVHLLKSSQVKDTFCLWHSTGCDKTLVWRWWPVCGVQWRSW